MNASSSSQPEASGSTDSLNSSGTSGLRKRTLAENANQQDGDLVIASKKPRSFADKDCISIMDSWYPNLWNGNCEEVETVCIPACLDVKKGAFLGPTDPNAHNYDANRVETHKSNIKGKVAEDAFLQTFCNLKIGGLLITGFQSKEFANKQLIKDVFKTEFEVDAVFFHSRLGIVFLEIKSVDNKSKDKSKRRKDAVEQLNKFRKGIPELWMLLSEPKISIKRVPLHFGLCFPNAILGNNKSQGETDLLRIDISDFRNPEKMKETFVSKMTANLSVEEQAALKTFACQIAAYRSGEFTSLFQNAMKVHQLVDELFMWTSKQTAVMERCMQIWLEKKIVHHQFILGWPGTGKTLLLQKLSLELAMRGEKVCIVASPSALRKKFVIFFAKNFPNQDNRPVIVDEWGKVKDEEYIFVDEYPFLHNFRCEDNGFMRPPFTLKPHQSALIVVTGAMRPQDLAKHWRTVIGKIEKMPNVSYEFFDTILRSPKRIYEKYRSNYEWALEISKGNMALGHTVSGPCVSEQTSIDISDSLNKATSIIKQLHAQSTSPLNDFSQMLIIIDHRLNHNKSLLLIQHELIDLVNKKYKITCGNVFDQIESGNKVALVETSWRKEEDILSMEWPIVIVIQDSCVGAGVILWYTRCTSQLFIIKQQNRLTLSTIYFKKSRRSRQL